MSSVVIKSVVVVGLLLGCLGCPMAIETPSRGDAGAVGGGPIELSNGLVRYEFTTNGGALALVRMASDAGAIEVANGPLFRLAVLDAGVLASSDSEALTLRRSETASSQSLEAEHRLRGGLAVIVRVTLAATAPRAQFSLAVDNQGNDSLLAWSFPLVSTRIGGASEDDVLLLPYLGGVVLPPAAATGLEGEGYPGSLSTQLLALFDVAEARGVSLVAIDPTASSKGVVVSSVPGGTLLGFKAVAADATVPGNALSLPFSFELGPFTGDWFDAARNYRRTALAHFPWMARALSARGPEAVRDLRMVLAPVNPSAGYSRDVTELALRYQRALGLDAGQLAVSPFLWNAGPFIEGEYLPPRAGFDVETATLRDAGIATLPYTNPRILPMALASFDGGIVEAVVRGPTGALVTETYVPGSPAAVLCPSANATTRRHVELVENLRAAVSIGGMHLDQIGSAPPRDCFDARHGHPLGGGHWWYDGYRRLISDVRAAATRLEPGFILTTEDPSEPYADVIDLRTQHFALGATTRARFRSGAPVPLTAVVSHTHASFMLSAAAVPASTSQLSFDAQHAWGYAIGNRLSTIDTSLEDSPVGVRTTLDLGLLRELVRSYDSTGRFLFRGDLLRFPVVTGAPEVSVEVPNPFDASARLVSPMSGVLATLWKEGGDHGLVLVNVTPAAVNAEVRLVRDDEGLARGGYVVSRRWPAPLSMGVIADEAVTSLSVRVPARAVVHLVLEPR